MFKDFLIKLDELKPDQKPLWGKMTAQHMVEHLIWSVQGSNGNLKFDCSFPPERLPAMKNFLLSDKPLQKLYTNPLIGPDLVELNNANLEEAKEILKEEISYYHTYFQQNPNSKPIHMIFGELNKEEWDVLHKKHFTLHLSQFGLIS
jgi:hypothetical protein